MKKQDILVHETSSSASDWKKFLFLILIGLPLVTFCLVGAYGLFVWIMQLFFWGPPS